VLRHSFKSGLSYRLVPRSNEERYWWGPIFRRSFVPTLTQFANDECFHLYFGMGSKKYLNTWFADPFWYYLMVSWRYFVKNSVSWNAMIAFNLATGVFSTWGLPHIPTILLAAICQFTSIMSYCMFLYPCSLIVIWLYSLYVWYWWEEQLSSDANSSIFNFLIIVLWLSSCFPFFWESVRFVESRELKGKSRDCWKVAGGGGKILFFFSQVDILQRMWIWIK